MITKNAIGELSKLLSLKFWFGGKFVYPWESPYNKVKNAAAITMDGFVQVKFKVHKNGKLRCMQVRSTRFLNLGIKPLQTITFDELRNRIALHTDKQSVPLMQMTSPVSIPVDLKGWNYLQLARRAANAATK